jgi:hypothetical protein
MNETCTTRQAYSFNLHLGNRCRTTEDGLCLVKYIGRCFSRVNVRILECFGNEAGHMFRHWPDAFLLGEGVARLPGPLAFALEDK